MGILKICAEPGCFVRTQKTRCPHCERKHNQRRNNRPEHRAHMTASYHRLRKQVLAEEPWCHWCGFRRSAECDFVVPLVQGGDVSRGNAVGACAGCNRQRGGMVRR